MIRATLFDYGVGNIHSLRKAFEAEGAEIRVTQDPKAALESRVLLLPGVGAFGKVARAMAPMRDELRQRLEQGLPAFCVCIGMQILFESSEESEGRGLGFLPGRVHRLSHQRLPHIGWNIVRHASTGLFAGIPKESHFYFVHSYAPSPCVEGVVGTTDYGQPFAAAIVSRNVWAVQFHPEKSSDVGRRVIANFIRFAESPS